MPAVDSGIAAPLDPERRRLSALVRRYARTFLAVFFALAAQRLTAQCVAFLVPPNVPIYADGEMPKLHPGKREDYVLVIPSEKISLSMGPQVVIARGFMGAPTTSPCFPDDFRRNKDGSRTQVRMQREKAGDFFDVWVSEKDCNAVAYDAPTAFEMTNGHLNLQDAFRNLRVIKHAADLKLDSIKSANFAPPEVANQETFAADFERTWSALIEALSDQKWQIEAIDKGSGLVTTKAAIDKRGETMACATQYDQEHRTWLNVFVKKLDGSTRVKVNATFRAMREDQAINCYSSGVLERDLFKAIRENIGSQPVTTPTK